MSTVKTTTTTQTKPRRGPAASKPQQPSPLRTSFHQPQPVVKRVKTSNFSSQYQHMPSPPISAFPQQMPQQQQPSPPHQIQTQNPPRGHHHHQQFLFPPQQQQQQHASSPQQARQQSSSAQQQQQQQQPSDDPISASILAIFPNWIPEEPSFLHRHGFTDTDQPIPAWQRHKDSNSPPGWTVANHTSYLYGGRRNAAHNLPDILEGPYAEYLDRYGACPEYFPHALLRHLESNRKNGYISPINIPPPSNNNNNNNNNNYPATPDSPNSSSPSSPSSSSSSSPSSSSDYGGGGSGTGTGGTNRATSPAALAPPNVPGAPSVYVVLQTQHGGYGRPERDFKVQGVYTTLEKANVRALELFRKRHRDFMPTEFPPPPAAGSNGGGGGRGVLLGGGGSNLVQKMPFVRSRNCEEPPPKGLYGGGGGSECWAGWWVDGVTGGLVLRAVNWGSGDGRLVVMRQDLVGS